MVAPMYRHQYHTDVHTWYSTAVSILVQYIIPGAWYVFLYNMYTLVINIISDKSANCCRCNGSADVYTDISMYQVLLYHIVLPGTLYGDTDCCTTAYCVISSCRYIGTTIVPTASGTTNHSSIPARTIYRYLVPGNILLSCTAVPGIPV